MFQSHLGRHESRVEAVGGAGGGDNGHGALAVAAVEHLQQVGLLALGGQSGRRPAALHVNDDERQLVDDGQVDGLALQANARSRGGRGGQGTREGGSHGTGAARYLVLALHRDDAARLVLGQFVEDVRSRRDGIGTQVKLQPGPLGGGDESVGRGLVARDVHVAAGYLGLAVDAVGGGHAGVYVVAVVVAGVHHLDVVLGYLRLLGELVAQEILHQRQVAIEEPADNAQGEHVAAFQDGLVVHAAVGQTRLHHLRDGARHDAVLVYAHLSEVVVAVELGLAQIVGSEAVGVDDDGGLRLGILVLRLERRGVHGHEHVALVARRVDAALSDVHLESRYARERPLRGADVGGIVRKSGDTVSDGCGNR